MVVAVAPEDLEQIVIDVLVAMGYGAIGEKLASGWAGPVTVASTA